MRYVGAKCSRLAVALMLLIMAGCCYIPPLGRQTSEEDLATIKVGITTKARVVELLGNPDILENERFSVYTAGKDFGGVILFGTASAAAFGLGAKYHRLLMAFDENDVLRRYQIESAKEVPMAGLFPYTPKALDATSSLITPERRLLFEDKWSIFGERLPFRAVAFSRDGRFLAAGDQKSRVWLQDLETGEKFVLDKLGKLKSLVFSPDSQTLAFLGKVVKILALPTGRELLTFAGHGHSSLWSNREATALAFSPDGKSVATGGFRGFVKIWDPVTGVETINFQAHKWMVGSIAFSPDGRLVATATPNDDEVKLWDTRTGNKLASVKPKNRQWGDHVVKFSPDGRMLAIHWGKHVELWRVEAGDFANGSSQVTPIGGLSDVFILPIFSPDRWRPALTLEFSPHGDTVAACNGAAVLFDLASSQPLWRFVPKDTPLHGFTGNDAVNAWAFGPDGRSFVTATNNGVYAWELPPSD